MNEYAETPKSYVPYEYIRGFIKFLSRNSDRIKIITYDDLCWGEGDTNQDHYQSEFKRWEAKKKTGILDNNFIYVLVQHDVDTLPIRTNEILLDEFKYNIPSNIMVFNKRINRKRLAKTGVVEIGDYALDWALLKKLTRDANFILGYHCNAYERAGFSYSDARKIMHEDINELSQKYTIRYMSAHGGVRDNRGFSNASLEIPESVQNKIKWVHNRYTVRFHAQYSDGGLNGARDPDKRDLRDFVKIWRPGKRYRVLLHPQYYDHSYSVSQRLMTASWYRELLEKDAAYTRYDPWNGIELNK